jgi:hypothetical protein
MWNCDSALATLFVVLVVFLVCREIVCWYWKINRGIALLTEIRDLLEANGPSVASRMGTSSLPARNDFEE